ncbi:MAG: Magnesium and cobalt efflux protein CorC [Syntrophus sp. SKADARSKE-3]|nr:Magnesium and cobalt efflux protein CorC [Syntrophus sp. SKADARSKE-3]
MSKVTSFFKSILPVKDQDQLEKEIQSIIDVGEEKGLLDAQSGEMIQSILEFRETVVREVMIPRTEIVAIRIDAAIEEIVELIARYGHTRMPVYSESVDNIVGILNVKDLVQYWSKPVTQADLLAILRKPYYIPETKNTHQLLHELKPQKHHMAIVIDEYGGTSGLVTLEDLIEEIVGDIRDEYETQDEQLIDLPDGYTLADGRIEIEELERRFGVVFEEGKYETLGGLILHETMKIPVTGEQFQIAGFDMVIEAADERSIKKVKLRKIDRETGKE